MPDMEKMDPEVFSMVMDTIDKLERDRVTLETKLEMDREGEFPMELIRFMLGRISRFTWFLFPRNSAGLGPVPVKSP